MVRFLCCQQGHDSLIPTAGGERRENSWTEWASNGGSGQLIGRRGLDLIRSIVHFCYNETMSIITVQDLQQNLPDFLRRVEGGESFLVVRDERPLAEVRPVPAPIVELRPFGLCTGQFTVPANFDQPLPDDILKEFEGA